MKLLPIAAALTLLASTRTPDELLFAPEEDLYLARTFESTASGALVGRALSADGEVVQEIEEDDLEGLFSYEALERISVTDEILESMDGLATDFRRSFDELLQENHQVAGEEEFDTTSSSDLEGHTVRFLWDDESEEFDVEWDGDEPDVDSELLYHLTDDLDLRAFLPEGDVEEGDEWEIDGDGYLPLMWPSGLLGFYDEDEDGVDEEMRDRNVQVVENLEGEGVALYEGTDDVDGVSVAVISIELTIETSAESLEPTEDGPEITFTIELYREIEGTFYWDLENNHLHSGSFEGDVEMTQRRTFVAETQDGDEVELEDASTFEGSIEYTITVERE